jgi:hypothetical protein
MWSGAKSALLPVGFATGGVHRKNHIGKLQYIDCPRFTSPLA